MKTLALIGLIAVFISLPVAADACTLSPQERLGEFLYKDMNLSINRNQSCQSCHHPSAGFADPDNRSNPYLFPVSEGSIRGRFGGRNAPTAAYAGYSPVMFYDPVEGLFIGGSFWDGRASGHTLGDPLAEQALGPFLNSVEMALPNKEAVVDRVLRSNYRALFKDVCGDPAIVGYQEAYNCVGKSIAAFERTEKLVRFTSRFDKFWAEQGKEVSTFGTIPDPVDPTRNIYNGVPPGFTSRHLTQLELKGLALFNAADKGNCAACHPTANFDANTPPMFTDYSYDNLGIFVNLRIADLAGVQPTDYGLGAKVDVLKEAYRRAMNAEMPNDWIVDGMVFTEIGKHKVSCLRNAGASPPYGHNGAFPTLWKIVHFYNTRDLAVEGWDPPEVPQTVNREELGNLGLNFSEELAIVAFIRTLTDQ
jgi:cytochrome c peroxidase